MRGSPTYLWRKVLLEFWNWWLGLAMAIFAIWALFALPLVKVYPVCVYPENVFEEIELRGEVTPAFNSQFVEQWGDISPISANRRVPILYYYAIDKEIMSYITGGALRWTILHRLPGVSFGTLTQDPPRHPHLWADGLSPNCDALRKIALKGGIWVDRGPYLWPDGDPDPDAPPIRGR